MAFRLAILLLQYVAALACFGSALLVAIEITEPPTDWTNVEIGLAGVVFCGALALVCSFSSRMPDLVREIQDRLSK